MPVGWKEMESTAEERRTMWPQASHLQSEAIIYDSEGVSEYVSEYVSECVSEVIRGHQRSSGALLLKDAAVEHGHGLAREPGALVEPVDVLRDKEAELAWARARVIGEGEDAGEGVGVDEGEGRGRGSRVRARGRVEGEG